MTTKYEVHITMDEAKDRECFVKSIVDSLGYTFSKIDNDLMIGPGTKMYATANYPLTSEGYELPAKQMHEAMKILKEYGCKVIRAKIELILFDKRYDNV